MLRKTRNEKMTPNCLMTLLCLQVLAFSCINMEETCRRDVPCPTGICTVTTECYHGSCTESGLCRCDGCWNGEACDVYENLEPYFTDSKYEVYISDSLRDGQHIFTATAFDEDEENWTSNAPCSKIIYGITEGNVNHGFAIDPVTGHVTITSVYKLLQRYYELTITASNVHVDGEPESKPASTLLSIYLGPSSQYENKEEGYLSMEIHNSPHHRSKRAAPTIIIPTNVTFTLIKKDKYENMTTIRVGEKVSLRLMIHFPQQTTDMLVELFTPDKDTTVMKLCNPVIAHIGSNLEDSFTNNPVIPELDAKDSTKNYDRAVLDLGNVTNNGVDSTDPQASMIYIDFDAVMIYNSLITNNTKYWVSAGAAYNLENDIWVGQAAFEAILDNLPTIRTQQFNLSGPTEMAVDSSAVFTVDMYIPHPSTTLRLDAFAPLNTSSVMTVCGMVIQDTAENFACLPRDTKAVMSKSDSGIGNWHGMLDLGTITNSGSRDETKTIADDRITVSITAHLLKEGSLVDDEHLFGVAVEVGEIIWAARAPVKVVAPVVQPQMVEVPSFSIDAVTGENALIGRPSVIELEMIVPENTESNYELEVITPDNGTVTFKICRIAVIYRGDNVPCVSEEEPVYSADDDAQDTNRAVLTLGKIKNTGVINGTLANTVKFEIVIQALNTTESPPDNKYWVTIGMNFTELKIWVVQQAFFVIEPPSDEVRTNPTFTMEYSFGNDTVPVGDSREILYKMHTVPNAVYEPAYIEVIMPDNVTTDGTTAALFTICKIEVIHAGKNVPCLNISEATKDVIYEDKHSRGQRDKGRLTLGNICNTGRYSSSEENTVIFSVIVKVENHPALSNGSMDWISMGIMLTNESMWVGQVAMYALLDMIVSSNPTGQMPYLGLTLKNNLTGNVPVGYIVTYNIFVKIPPMSSNGYTINVTSESTELSLCGLRLIEYGDHLPCMDLSTAATYTPFQGSLLYESAQIYLGPITSFGPEAWMVNDTAEFSDDTLRLEVTLKLSPKAGDLSTHDFRVRLDLSDISPLEQIETITATTDNSEINSNSTVGHPPIVAFYAVNIDDLEGENATFEIAPGEAKRFITDIILQEPFLSDISVRFFTPINNTAADIEICAAQLISVGANIPCLQQSDVAVNYEKTYGGVVNDVATLNLGYACVIPLETSTNETNKLRVEAIFKVNPDTNLTSATISSTLRIGDSFIVVTDMDLSIKENLTQQEFTYYNHTNMTLPVVGFNLTADNMTIGEFMTVPVTVTFPGNTTGHALIDIKLPVNDSAHMTVEEIKVVSAGKNIACLVDFTNLNISFISSQNTSQNDAGYVDLGIVTNTGFTYRANDFQEEDDDINLEFVIQMADSEVNTKDSYHEISVAVEYGGIIILFSRYVQVLRDDTEIPELEIIAEANITDNLSPSDILPIDAVLKHLNTSTAEGLNVTVSFYLPPYVTFVALNYSNVEATTEIEDGSILRVQFPRVYFTDTVLFGVLLQVLSNASTAVSLVDAITPYQAGSVMHYRPDNTRSSAGEVFTTEFKHLSYKVTAPSQSGCSEPLGMQDGRIGDCQISGSICPDPSRLPHHGRLNGASGWSPFRRPGKLNEQRHMQVYFGNKTKVSHIMIKHPSYPSSRVAELQIYYSDDGKAWLPGEKMIPSLPNYDTVDLPILTPRESRYVRLYVLSNRISESDLVGLQVEFFGCQVSSDVTDACPLTDSVSPAPEFTERSFLSTGSEVFACDAEPTIDLSMRCVTSADGSNWKVLDPSVGNIIGFNPSTDELFALSVDKLTYLMSLDRGITWSCILPEMWTSVKATCVDPIPVHWTYSIDLSGASPVPTYTQNSWGALYDGLYQNTGSWSKRLDWASCC